MSTLLTSNWTFMRALRLVLGIAFMVSAYMQRDIIPALIGGLFMYQSIMNIGCAGGACYTPAAKQPAKADIQDVEYEEIS